MEKEKIESWERNGLQPLVEDAIHKFTRSTGIYLPYNLESWGPYRDSRWREKHFDNMGVVEETARFAGWLKAAANIRELRWLISKALCARGMGSPYQQVNLWDFVKRNRSPHKLARFIRRTRQRSNQLLRAYGIKVSGYGLLRSILDTNIPVGKAAMKAAALTINEYCRRYGIFFLAEGKSRNVLIKARGLRDGLEYSAPIRSWAANQVEAGEFSCFREAISYRSRLEEDNTDGVKLLIDPMAAMVKVHGIEVKKGWDNTGKEFFLVLGIGRSYHCAVKSDYAVCRDDGFYTYYRTPREAIKVAISAWQNQKRFEQKNQALLERLFPDDRTILVYREDSYQAGNCQKGTAVFAERSGFGERSFVPAAWLRSHLDNVAVCRVLQLVASRL